MNILRGTGRRGLTSLRTTDGIVRPLLDYDKEEIISYAIDHAVAWREDSTNQDAAYTRNRIRMHVMPSMTPGQRAQLIILLKELHSVNDELDKAVINLLHTQPGREIITRNWFVHLPHDIAREVVHGWLRHNGVANISRATVERVVIAIKTAHPGKSVDIDKQLELHIDKTTVQLRKRSPSHKKRAKKHVS